MSRCASSWVAKRCANGVEFGCFPFGRPKTMRPDFKKPSYSLAWRLLLDDLARRLLPRIARSWPIGIQAGGWRWMELTRTTGRGVGRAGCIIDHHASSYHSYGTWKWKRHGPNDRLDRWIGYLWRPNAPFIRHRPTQERQEPNEGKFPLGEEEGARCAIGFSNASPPDAAMSPVARSVPTCAQRPNG